MFPWLRPRRPGFAHDGAQPRAGGKQAGSLAIHQLHVVGFGDVDFADALQLQQLAFHHHLRQRDQQIQHVEIALAQGHLEGLHIQPVARQHAGMIAPDGVGRRTAAAGFGDVDDIVVHQRGGVNHFDHGGHANGAVADSTDQLRGQQDQNGPQPLARRHLADTAKWR